MRIAIVGCGMVADLYMMTLPQHPDLTLVGVADRVQAHAQRFSSHYGVKAYGSVQELLDDPRVEMVLNLTNPRSHFAVSRACLAAGKHVYSEKPLSMRFEEAEELVAFAAEKGLRVSCAPSRLLGETAQTMWRQLRDNAVGTVRLCYAEMDDGLVHRMRYKQWITPSGASWPYKDEFETGCTVEHAGYAVTWLAAFFGPAESVTAFSTVLVKDKQTDVALDPADTPDFSVACIRYRSGIVARLTSSIVAPHDHSIRIFGDDGVLSTDDCWKPLEPVYVRRRVTLGSWSKEMPWRSKVPLLGGTTSSKRARGLKKVDFCLGPVELVNAVREGRPSRLSPAFCLHVCELVLATQGALENASTVKLRSTFDPVDPMPWAR